MKLFPEIVAPRHEAGIDYGRDGRVLAASALYRLVWRPGSTYWSGMSGNRYSPSTLSVVHNTAYEGHRTNRHGTFKQLRSGGRLSAKLVALCAPEIDGVFGEGTADAIRIGQTLVIGNEVPTRPDAGT